MPTENGPRTGDAGRGLFGGYLPAPLPRSGPVHRAGPAPDADRAGGPAGPTAPVTLLPTVGQRLVEVWERVRDPRDGLLLRDLYLARVEAELGGVGELAQRWRCSRRLRRVEPTEVLASRATSQFVKELFNWFFRDDLYGRHRPLAELVLSSGSVDEQSYGVPPVLKQCISYALDRDWYGYSDSRGRLPAREAVAELANAGTAGAPYTAGNVALTLGGSVAVSSVADFVLSAGRAPAPALCALPNYPPLVESIARRAPIRLVPLPCVDGQTDLTPLLEAVEPATPLVLLQTVTNPTGTAVAEEQLATLVKRAGPDTVVLLDECHECLGEPRPAGPARAAPNVVRVSSLSKTLSAPGMKIGWLLADAGFVDCYYEYASTTFGGPPSFFYTLVEVMARMERWLLDGREQAGSAETAEFEASYRLSERDLAVAYADYRRHRTYRDEQLVTSRELAVQWAQRSGLPVVRPAYSINLTLRLPGPDDGYLAFRRLLASLGVSVYPGILAFCFDGGWVRLTTARRPEELAEGLRRIGGYLAEAGVPAAVPSGRS